MRMPDELLDKVFEHVFAPYERKPLRECVCVSAPFSLVCRAWQRVVVPYAWTNVRLDVVKDADAIACLDPVGGVGAHLLSLVSSLHLSATKPLIEPAQTGEKNEKDEGEDKEEEKEGGEDEDEDALAARRSPILHGPADDETSALPIVASVVRILSKCSNLSVLSIDHHLESISCKVAVDYDPSVVWPELTHLKFTWGESLIDLLPVLPRLSRLQTLTDLTLLLGTSDEEDDRRGTMTQELVDQYPVQPLDRLERFLIRSLAEAPIGNKAILPLLSPRAPLWQVTWGGYVPPGLCKQLSYGTTEIKELTFTWLLPTMNLTNQLLPQLLELDRRPVKKLTFDIGPASTLGGTQSMPPITAVLKSIPHGVQFSRATDMDSFLSAFGFHQSFPSDDAEFAAIKARPTAQVTLGMKGEWSGSLDGRALLQVGMFHVERESDDDVNLRFFGRFGDPDVEGDVTEWMLLKIVASEDDEEE